MTIEWHSSLSDATADAVASGRLVLVFFRAPG